MICQMILRQYRESCNIWTLMDDAADAIERLMAEVEELKRRKQWSKK